MTKAKEISEAGYWKWLLASSKALMLFILKHIKKCSVLYTGAGFTLFILCAILMNINSFMIIPSILFFILTLSYLMYRLDIYICS